MPVERGSSQDVLDPVGTVQPHEATLTPVTKDLGTTGADKVLDQELDFSSNNEQGYQGNHNHSQIYPSNDPTQPAGKKLSSYPLGAIQPQCYDLIFLSQERSTQAVEG